MDRRAATMLRSSMIRGRFENLGENEVMRVVDSFGADWFREEIDDAVMAPLMRRGTTHALENESAAPLLCAYPDVTLEWPREALPIDEFPWLLTRTRFPPHRGDGAPHFPPDWPRKFEAP
jgi:hypothetical protein